MPPPSLTLSFNPPGPALAISSDAVMPDTTVTANVGLAGPLAPPAQFVWKITLIYNGIVCPHAVGRTTSHPPINVTTATNSLRIPFTAVRGGTLSVTVTTQVAGAPASATATLQINGTNPTLGALQAATLGAPDLFKKLMRLESGLRQFLSPACPLFSGDNLGGVGLCQITPAINDDQIWSWKQNLQDGLALWAEKRRIAAAYPNHVRQSPEFSAQVAAYNAQRMARPANPPLRPISITVPDYTPDQLDLDTVRGFNGFAAGVHEYRLLTDANGILVVTVDPAGATGVAQWQQISPAERTAIYDQLNVTRRGDVNYVADVQRQASF